MNDMAISQKESYLRKFRKFLNLNAESKIKDGRLYIKEYGLFSSPRFPEGNETKLSNFVREKSKEFKVKYDELETYYFFVAFTSDEIAIEIVKNDNAQEDEITLCNGLHFLETRKLEKKCPYCGDEPVTTYEEYLFKIILDDGSIVYYCNIHASEELGFHPEKIKEMKKVKIADIRS